MSTETLASLAVSFRLAVQAEQRAAGTIRLHQQAIRFYSDWLTRQGLPADLAHFTRPLIRGWLADLAEINQPNTVRTRFLGLSRFGRWLVDEEILPVHPMTNLHMPTQPEHPVPLLTDADLAALLKQCAGKDFNSRRDETMLRLLLDCGVRVGELCGLTVDGIDLVNRVAVVKGKGSRVRPIYLSARTARAVDRYLRIRRGHRHADSPALLLTQRGGMSTDGARERVRVLAAAAGLKHIHPHQFRHSFAHDFLLAGGQQTDLKRLAGWTSDAMLARYASAGADVRAQHAARSMSRGDRV
jgi:site-specific recombinase XerD